ncbi:MAG: K(+)-transporting ATPase subunit C [Cyanobacteria bacterium CRU_2_1]|nr:K(+)-transporting ATPase subunit C [Cyanobacteria bacterium CRU_2_1]
MSVTREIGKAIRSTLVLWLLTAIIYPFLMIVIGQLVFPVQANGSLITREGTFTTNPSEAIGSMLIGQPFSSDRYFWSRPSTSRYSTADPNNDEAGILNTGVSGASNLAPSNPALIDRIKGVPDPDPEKAIEGEIPRLQSAGIQPTADLVYTSGSSLDPHLTPEGARAQIDRISRTRGISTQDLERLITQNTDDRFLGIFGEPGVNVLRLNLALDAFQPAS